MENREKIAKKIKNNRRTIYLATGIILAVVIVVLALALIFGKDKEFSEKENRTLAQKPELSFTAVKDGSFMTDLEDYVADQFALRDSWISLKLSVDMLLGKKEANGVYIGKDDQLIEIPDEPDYEEIDKNLDAIKKFAERHEDLNILMTLVPNACLILSDKMPTDAPVHDQNEDLDHAIGYLGNSLTFVDLRDTLKSHSDEYIYYKTDHHWTSLAAGYAFDTLKTPLGIDGAFSNYKKYTVTDSFSGTLASKCGYMKAKDEIDIYMSPEEITYAVNYVEEGEKSSSIYDASKLETQSKYEVFFGGNFSRINIETTNDSEKSLLILKDSYANCFVQFLLPYYKDIVIIDPRYYYDDIEMIIKSGGITDVLFLYNVNTFNGDRFIADILELQE